MDEQEQIALDLRELVNQIRAIREGLDYNEKHIKAFKKKKAQRYIID